MESLQIIWSNQAKQQLKEIYQYLKYHKNTPQGAESVKRDILDATKSLHFSEQYQKDDINANYRRIIVRDYKLVYKVDNQRILILKIFHAKQNPDKLLKDVE